tara:strand:- start:18 stop:254 length:237 start_codon:yes stop_codon:yes gene_type:complete
MKIRMTFEFDKETRQMIAEAATHGDNKPVKSASYDDLKCWIRLQVCNGQMTADETLQSREDFKNSEWMTILRHEEVGA